MQPLQSKPAQFRGRYLPPFESLYETERVSTEKGEVLRQARQGKARKSVSGVVHEEGEICHFREVRVWRKGIVDR